MEIEQDIEAQFQLSQNEMQNDVIENIDEHIQNEIDDLNSQQSMTVPQILQKSSATSKKHKIKQLKQQQGKKKVQSRPKDYTQMHKQNIKIIESKLHNSSLKEQIIPPIPTAQNSEQVIEGKCYKCATYKSMLFQLANMIAPTSTSIPPSQHFQTIKNYLKFGPEKVSQNKNKQLNQLQQKQLSQLSDQRITLLKIKERLVQAKLPTQDIVSTISDLIANHQTQRQEIRRVTEQNNKYIKQIRQLQNRNNNSDYDALKQQLKLNQQANNELNEQINEIMEINKQLQDNCDGFKQLNEMLTNNIQQIQGENLRREKHIADDFIHVLHYFKRNGHQLEDLILRKVKWIHDKVEEIQANQYEIFSKFYSEGKIFPEQQQQEAEQQQFQDKYQEQYNNEEIG